MINHKQVIPQNTRWLTVRLCRSEHIPQVSTLFLGRISLNFMLSIRKVYKRKAQLVKLFLDSNFMIFLIEMNKLKVAETTE